MSSSRKRERELARAKYERQQARRAAEAEKRKKRNSIIAVVAVLAIVIGGVTWFALSGRSSEPDVALPPSPDASASPAATDATGQSPAASQSPSGAASSPAQTAAVDCSDPPAVRPDNLTWGAPPEMTIDDTASYDLTLATNCGDITIALDAADAPDTVNSMIFLADQQYFDLTACHRLTTEGIFVLQCGDPKGDGTGGPGYAVPDENLPADGTNNYPAGTVAMANAGPGTGGSQFFLVYQDTTLPPNYTVFGTVTSGLDVIQGVAAAGVQGGGADGPPAQPVVIETATVSES